MTAPSTIAPPLATGSRTAGGSFRAVALGTLVAGTLDICAAMLLVELRGIPALQAVKGVAAGWLGRDAFRGDAGVITLGFVTHFLIMSVIVLAFYGASRVLPGLLRRWVAAGIAYGAAVYLFMQFVVIPLSAFPDLGPLTLVTALPQLFVHMVCVGLPIAFITVKNNG